MLNALAVARKLADADFTPAQVDAATDAVRTVAAHGDHVTPDLSPQPSPRLGERIDAAEGHIDGQV